MEDIVRCMSPTTAVDLCLLVMAGIIMPLVQGIRMLNWSRRSKIAIAVVAMCIVAISMLSLADLLPH
ncbi:hypothetical protein HY634_00735 [Candidatus Uhrbacteria bacterium]|nr:hypothetical protein [Candidatus Uhrbacteria bacterium]